MISAYYDNMSLLITSVNSLDKKKSKIIRYFDFLGIEISKIFVSNTIFISNLYKEFACVHLPNYPW